MRGELLSMFLPCSEPSDVRNLKRLFYLKSKVRINVAQVHITPLSDNFFSFNQRVASGHNAMQLLFFEARLEVDIALDMSPQGGDRVSLLGGYG